MDFSQDLIRGSVVPIVLALLEERPRYGYEIVKIVNARTNGRFEWKEGTLYPTLHRLEADRLVRSRWRDKTGIEPEGGSGGGASGGGGAKRRKYYAITRRGLGELARRRAEWRQFSEAVNAMLIGG